MHETKAFIISPRGQFCIAVYRRMPPNAIKDELRMVAQNLGYPICIEWANPDWKDTIISHRSEEELEIRKQIRYAELAIEQLEEKFSTTIQRQPRITIKREIKRWKSEIRRLNRQCKKLNKKEI